MIPVLVQQKKWFALLMGFLMFVGADVTATEFNCPVFQQPLGPANAGCLIVEDGAVLMLKQWNAKWSLPGGTTEPGEAAQCTAARETWEETGLKVAVGALIHVYDNKFHLFQCTRLVGEPRLNLQRPFTLEVIDVAWVADAQFDQLTWRFSGQRQVIERWLRQQP